MFGKNIHLTNLNSSLRRRQELCERVQIPAVRIGPTGSLRHKNDLTASDAGQVKVNFRAKLVTFAVGSLRTPTTCDLRKPGRSDARQAMNSPFPCVGASSRSSRLPRRCRVVAKHRD